MASIKEILKTEETNTGDIHLFREGMFLKAYQSSAYLFFNNVKEFKTIKKHYKAAGCNVIMLGFPSTRFAELFPEEDSSKAAGAYIRISCKSFDRADYKRWFDSIELQSVKSEQAEPDILAKIRQFSVERATPLECMMFLSELKSDLDR